MSYEEPSPYLASAPSLIESLETFGELVESFEVLTVFVVFAILALRTRNVRSFQFQVSAFMLLWVIAEFPQALAQLQIIDIKPVLLPGLIFHTTSMIAFAFFITYRFIPFLRTGPVLRLDESTKQIVLEAVQEGLASVLGENTSKAVNFYVDPTLAMNKPEAYMRGLRKIFGDGAKLLEERISGRLCVKADVKPLPGKSFAEQVLTVNRTLMTRAEEDRVVSHSTR